MNVHSNIRKLPANNQGNDYVVGDLHGCVDLLWRLLEETKFDQSKDRLFAVGDLIDRGPDSLECLRLLKKPWFFGVQGNHENMMMAFFEQYLQNGRLDTLEDINQSDFLWNGGDWIEQSFLPKQRRMTPEFNQGLILALDMPLIWVVGEDANRFHVIHAELSKPGFRNLETPVWLDSDIDQWLEQQHIPSNVEERLYWSRAIMTEAQQRPLPTQQSGLSATFCGHTYSVRPRQVLSHICIDTGAFLSMNPQMERVGEEHGLTLFDVRNACWLSASYQRKQVIWGETPMQA